MVRDLDLIFKIQVMKDGPFTFKSTVVIGYKALEPLLPFNPLVIYFSNSNCKYLCEEESSIFFIFNKKHVHINNCPLCIGYKLGYFGIYEERTCNFEFYKKFYLEDQFSLQLAVYMMKEFQNTPKAEYCYYQNLALTLGGYLLKKYNLQNSLLQEEKVVLTKYKLNLINNYIQDNINSTLSVQELANLVDTSVSHFIRVFKQATSHTPYQYIKVLKMRKAKGLLCETELSIKQIALKSGFENSSHFTQVFKGNYGLTPFDFRNALIVF